MTKKAETVEPFPLQPTAMFKAGVQGFLRAPVQLLFGAMITFGISVGMYLPFRDRISDNPGPPEFFVMFVGFVFAATGAYFWYSYALDAARGNAVELAKPFRTWERLPAQFVASFWFWAGLLIGIPMMFLPALIVLIFYAFYGFVIVDRPDLGGLKALGTSVRLGDKRRIALFAIATLALLFNFIVPAMAFTIKSSAVAVPIWLALLLVTTSITMVGGAALYDVLNQELADG
jgi:hypothetical protein